MTQIVTYVACSLVVIGFAVISAGLVWLMFKGIGGNQENTRIARISWYSVVAVLTLMLAWHAVSSLA